MRDNSPIRSATFTSLSTVPAESFARKLISKNKAKEEKGEKNIYYNILVAQIKSAPTTF